jgi:hypothetical protein
MPPTRLVIVGEDHHRGTGQRRRIHLPPFPSPHRTRRGTQTQLNKPVSVLLSLDDEDGLTSSEGGDHLREPIQDPGDAPDAAGRLPRWIETEVLRLKPHGVEESVALFIGVPVAGNLHTGTGTVTPPRPEEEVLGRIDSQQPTNRHPVRTAAVAEDEDLVAVHGDVERRVLIFMNGTAGSETGTVPGYRVKPVKDGGATGHTRRPSR